MKHLVMITGALVIAAASYMGYRWYSSHKQANVIIQEDLEAQEPPSWDDAKKKFGI